MEYQVEELSPVKKKVNVQVSAEEVNAALEATIAFMKKDLKLSGFRKGKIPSSVVESRFKKDIYEQTARDLLNVHFNEVLNNLGVQPVSELDVDTEQNLQKNAAFHYSFSFEMLPEIELPEYHGLKITQQKIQVPEPVVDKAIHRIQKENSQLEFVNEERTPQDGDVAVIDFATYKDGELLKDFQAKDFELPIGEGQTLKDFEDMVKRLKQGESDQADITLPEDFINSDIAGQTVQMWARVNVIKQRKLPEVDEELAQKVGGYESVAKMREAITQNFYDYFQNMEKSGAQKKMVDQLASMVDVALPETMISNQIQSMLEMKQSRLERQGKSLESEGPIEEIQQKLRPEAEELVKAHLILLAIAKKQELEVTNQEVEQHIYRLAIQSGQDPKQLRDSYEKNNLMFALRDSLLADKAMEYVYNQAEIEEVERDDLENEASSETQDARNESGEETS
jgi:trigger factor